MGNQDGNGGKRMLGAYELPCKLELWVAHAGRDWFKYYLTGIYPGLRLQRKIYRDLPVKGARSLLVFQHAAFPEADPDAPENPAYAGCVWEFILQEGAPCCAECGFSAQQPTGQMISSGLRCGDGSWAVRSPQTKGLFPAWLAPPGKSRKPCASWRTSRAGCYWKRRSRPKKTWSWMYT